MKRKNRVVEHFRANVLNGLTQLSPDIFVLFCCWSSGTGMECKGAPPFETLCHYEAMT